MFQEQNLILDGPRMCDVTLFNYKKMLLTDHFVILMKLSIDFLVATLLLAGLL